MEIIIIWLVLSIIAGVIASNKGRSALGFILLSVILSPLIGILAALIASENNKKVEDKKIATGENKKCPFCAEIIKTEAVVCRYCGKDLNTKKEEAQTKDQENIGEQELMDKYGIMYINEKYTYKEYQYNNLQDAINYAKLQS